MSKIRNQKRIGIITLSASDNCGSLLQAFALQQILKERFAYRVEIINLKTKKSARVYDLFTKDFYRHPRKTLFVLMHIRSIWNQKRDYEDFRKQYLDMTHRVYKNISDLKHLKYDYDVIIAGSDQLWNADMLDYDDAFFIPWETSAKKVAYSVSLGSLQKYDSVKTEHVRKWLKNFDMISVREVTGKQTLEVLTNKRIEILADPTLLIEPEEWKLLAGGRMISKEYIFYYSWAYSDVSMNKIVQRFAKEKSLDVYVINSSKWRRFRPEKFGFWLYEKSGPIAFINLMLYAKYVFVQSFHGVVFSNILKKRFFFLNENIDVDFRADNMLKIFHEENQIIHSWEDMERAMNTNLTYTSEEYMLLVNKSLEYLSAIEKLF
ncbi:MAG: polysaccharide pyruvyl transferase family protein [Roseburia sp.]|nr:polysaccharide pyruvyl transferase family protein [Roseburia sp.]MCM1432034.1 polysaccharide pyruvyl transferase family protein [Muribaculaceae bacterium]